MEAGSSGSIQCSWNVKVQGENIVQETTSIPQPVAKSKQTRILDGSRFAVEKIIKQLLCTQGLRLVFVCLIVRTELETLVEAA